MKTLTLPGLIDPHVHLRDPGQTHKEDFLSGSKAAAAGGYTTILDMPNNTTPIFTVKALREKKKLAAVQTVCDIGFYFGTLGDNLDEFPKAAKNGVYGLKIYLNHTTGGYILEKKQLLHIFQTWPATIPILLHAEGETFTLALEVLRKHPRKVHLCHLSTKYELERVMEAKTEGLPITCGVTPHHLFLDASDEKRLGPYGKMRPPLSTKRDVAYLWKYLGAIDCIESDHAPHTREEKMDADAPNGVTGLETTLPLLLTAVADGKLELHEIIRLCHDGPARIFNVRQAKGTYVEVDLERTYTLQDEKLYTKAGWSPFHGYRVKGKIVRTVLRDVTAYEDGRILAAPGSGAVI